MTKEETLYERMELGGKRRKVDPGPAFLMWPYLHICSCCSPYLQFSLFSWWILTYFSRLASWAYYLFLKQFIDASITALICYYSCLLICFPFELLSADKIFYSIFVSLVPFPGHILNYHVTYANDFFRPK